MNNLIKDQAQFDKFIEILPELKKDEVYFISLSARNKYLTKEEREFYSLGQTEMFGREIAQSKDKLANYIMKKLEATLSYKTTRNKKSIPEKSLVVYANINPSSMIKAYYQFQNEMNRQMSEIMLALQNDKQPNYSFVNIQTRELMNCIQKSTGTKHYVDIDCDTKELKVLNYFKEVFMKDWIKFYIIETKGGYHFLLKKDTFPEKYNLMNIIADTKKILINLHYNQGDFKKDDFEFPEIIINSNAMIPVPGTMQSDHLVRFVDL
jgi:hypothetical protein